MQNIPLQFMIKLRYVNLSRFPVQAPSQYSDSLCPISSNRNLKDTWFFFFGNRSLSKVLRVLLTPSTTSLQLSENPYCTLLISQPQNQSTISLHHRLFIQQDFSFQNKVRKVLLWELRLRKTPRQLTLSQHCVDKVSPEAFLRLSKTHPHALSASILSK